MNQDVTLLDILIDGFEKNEILLGFHWRSLPLANEAEAIRKFAALVEEARRWKGQPLRLQDESTRRLAAWTDLEIRQSGRGIMILARAPNFDRWWHDAATWEGDPMGSLFDWMEEDRLRQ
jgi:hypothetical protein